MGYIINFYLVCKGLRDLLPVHDPLDSRRGIRVGRFASVGNRLADFGGLLARDGHLFGGDCAYGNEKEKR